MGAEDLSPCESRHRRCNVVRARKEVFDRYTIRETDLRVQSGARRDGIAGIYGNGGRLQSVTTCRI